MSSLSALEKFGSREHELLFEVCEIALALVGLSDGSLEGDDGDFGGCRQAQVQQRWGQATGRQRPKPKASEKMASTNGEVHP